jgi:glucose/arabinose dehydrogenase
VAALATLAGVVVAGRAHAALSTSGFRAVGVAHATYPISALAAAPDGRLFATVQAKGQTSGTTPGTAEIRVYTSFATTDGALLDEGTVWATVDGVRATTAEEGLLGIALAPDFATSKLVYVYLTTTDEAVNQHVRVYRENAGGTGDYLGAVATTLEPAAESSTRNGGPLGFGVDGCLYLGVGDNGSSSRWNAQLLLGTDPIQSSENTALCTNVCLGSSLYPTRTVTNNGQPNHAGKILRMAVDGASPASPAPGAPLASQPFVFGAGMRSPVGLVAHPLTGQLYATERGDGLQTELDVVDLGTNEGWPCLEGGAVAASASCLVGRTPADVYANHPDWRRPLATHTGNPVPGGLTAYSGLGYPAEFYGDVFYLLRDSARIYRIDLDPPCFLPHPNGVVPVAFHDATDDDDFRVLYDLDDDGDYENASFFNLVAIVQAFDPLGQQVLYVAGKQGNSNALTDDTMIFRIEFATVFTPYAGALGRVPDSCFTDAVYSGGGSGTPPYGYENPFQRAACRLPGGPCLGQADGTSCEDGNPCNGAETCQSGVCAPGVPPANGTSCASADRCHADGVCQAGACAQGGPLPDGTPCPDSDPCNGLETCAAGVCQPGSGAPAPLTVRGLTLKREKSGSGAMALSASIVPTAPLAPEATDDLTLELREGADPMFSDTLEHPASDRFWKRLGRRSVRYTNRRERGRLGSVALKGTKSGAVQVEARGKRLAFSGMDAPEMRSRLVVGDQCFEADLTCVPGARKVRCRTGTPRSPTTTTTTLPPATTSTTTTSTTSTTTTTTTTSTTTTTTTTTTTSSTTTTATSTTVTTTSSTTTTEAPPTTSTSTTTATTSTTTSSTTSTTTETTTTTTETTTTTTTTTTETTTTETTTTETTTSTTETSTTSTTTP